MTTLGSLTVREKYGIRRFLYPLATRGMLPEGCPTATLGLRTPEGVAVPVQVTMEDAAHPRALRLDFAVSLGPYERLVLALCSDMAPEAIDDPLRLQEAALCRSTQRRFEATFDHFGNLHQIAYDARPHLRHPATILCNGACMIANAPGIVSGGPLSAHLAAAGRYPDGRAAVTELDITACKSWTALTHILREPRAGDEVTFTLPLAVTAPVLPCDFGAGGGIYGKLQPGNAPELVWSTSFLREDGVEWSLAAAGRIDYRGTAASSAEYRSQRWFHLIDRGKALAVAITGVPDRCRAMMVTLRATGDVLVTFQLGDAGGAPAVCSLCYHFLNDIPPLSAATSPQSILLPPEVVTVMEPRTP